MVLRVLLLLNLVVNRAKLLDLVYFGALVKKSTVMWMHAHPFAVVAMTATMAEVAAAGQWINPSQWRYGNFSAKFLHDIHNVASPLHFIKSDRS
jgi:hypothetical protein